MKTILLAAAAVIAVPTMAIAQDTPQQTPQTGTMQPDTTTAPDATAPADAAPAPSADTTADPAASQQQAPMQSAPSTGDAATPPSASPASPQPAAGGAMGTETAGGYQPSQPALSGTPQPGATVRFQPAPSPDQAFPAPAAKSEYPVCKKGQYDGCMQASDAGGKKRARARRR